MIKYNFSAGPIKWIPFLICLFFTTALTAQKNMEDVVYLKNGSIIRGTVVEIKTSDFVKVEIIGGSIFYFKMEEVDSIMKEPAIKIHKKGEYNYKQRGYFNETGFHFLFGNGANHYGDGPSIGAYTVNGYQLWPQLRAGAGIGIDYYSGYDITIAPLTLRVSGDLLQKPVTPYYFAEAGHGFNLADDAMYDQKGGLIYGAGFGVKFNSRSATTFILNLNYRSQNATLFYSDWWGGGIYATKYSFRRIGFSAAISF